MSGELLLDTNVVIGLLAGEKSIRDRLSEGPEVLLSSVVLGELYYGARKSARSEENMAQVESLAANVEILDCDVDTARHYGAIKNELRIRGRPIPENDIWLAALVRQYDLTLVSRDRHFAEVESLVWQQW